MARNERFMPVPPEAVWAALADAGGYAYWVVGSREIRDADAAWPAAGARFHHTVGVGPLSLRDHTVSLEAQRPRRLVLRAKGRPLGTARVTLELTPQAGGTHVSMVEDPDGWAAPLRLNPFLHLFTRGRNAESLMRLEELALRQAGERTAAA